MTSAALKPVPAFSAPARGRQALNAATTVVVALLSLPFLALAAQLFAPEYEIWSHLADTVLKHYLIESLALCAGVMAGTLLLGVPTAWLCSACDFPARRFFEFALILPLAYPAYIAAYVYTGVFDYGGVAYAWLSAAGLHAPLPIRSLGGAIAVLTLVLYPYVYLLARASFMQQSNRIIEAGRTLGTRPGGCFLHVALPAARPAIIAGVALVMMETLADFGTVEYFGVNTFSVGIFRTWFGLGSIAGAAQLSVLLLAFVVALLIMEKRARRRARYYDVEPRPTGPSYHLHGVHAAGAIAVCALPLLLGFAVPTLQLSTWAAERLPETELSGYATLVANTFGLALASSLVILTLAIVVSYTKRLYPTAGVKLAVQTVSSGYAIPGVVIAIGVLILFSALDRWGGLALGGGFIALTFAYAIRFLTLGFNSVEAALEKVSPDLDHAAHALAASTLETLAKVHLPLIRGGLLTAALLVFVEVIKELPATLVLRPFNFNTLAVRAFELASDERLADVALPALSIVAVGVLPLIVLARATRTP